MVMAIILGVVVYFIWSSVSASNEREQIDAIDMASWFELSDGVELDLLNLSVRYPFAQSIDGFGTMPGYFSHPGFVHETLTKNAEGRWCIDRHELSALTMVYGRMNPDAESWEEECRHGPFSAGDTFDQIFDESHRRLVCDEEVTAQINAKLEGLLIYSGMVNALAKVKNARANGDTRSLIEARNGLTQYITKNQMPTWPLNSYRVTNEGEIIRRMITERNEQDQKSPAIIPPKDGELLEAQRIPSVAEIDALDPPVFFDDAEPAETNEQLRDRIIKEEAQSESQWAVLLPVIIIGLILVFVGLSL